MTGLPNRHRPRLWQTGRREVALVAGLVWAADGVAGGCGAGFGVGAVADVGGSEPLGSAGTGVGLAIVRKILDNHKSGITASSVVDEGSTFNIYLPS